MKLLILNFPLSLSKNIFSKSQYCKNNLHTFLKEKFTDIEILGAITVPHYNSALSLHNMTVTPRLIHCPAWRYPHTRQL